MNDDRVVLTSAADDKYALPLAVLLKSAETNLRAGWGLDAHVVDGGLRDSSRRRIEQGLDANRTRVHWIATPAESLVEGLPVFGHVGVSTYYRILIPGLLTADIPKAVYLDADCLVTGDLAELWETDMQGAPLLAVYDGRTCDALAGSEEARRRLEIPPGAKRANGGVLVMDLDLWRREDIASRILRYLREYRDTVEFWDQDGINAVLVNRWIELHQKWNYRVDCHKKLADPVRGQTRVDDLERDTAVIHFASATKPWHAGVVHPGKDLYFKYVGMTEWRRWRPTRRRPRPYHRHRLGAWIRALPVLGGWWRRLRGLSEGDRE